MERAAELIQCAAILHNICILFNDDGADLLDDEDLEIDEGEGVCRARRGAGGQTTRALGAFSLN